MAEASSSTVARFAGRAELFYLVLALLAHAAPAGAAEVAAAAVHADRLRNVELVGVCLDIRLVGEHVAAGNDVAVAGGREAGPRGDKGVEVLIDGHTTFELHRLLNELQEWARAHGNSVV